MSETLPRALADTGNPFDAFDEPVAANPFDAFDQPAEAAAPVPPPPDPPRRFAHDVIPPMGVRGPPPAAGGPSTAPSAPAEQGRIERAVRSPWEAPLVPPDIGKPITGNQYVDVPLKAVIVPPVMALDAAGRVISSVARGAGAVAGTVHDALGGEPAMGARLERDIGQLPAALAPVFAPGAAPRGATMRGIGPDLPAAVGPSGPLGGLAAAIKSAAQSIPMPRWPEWTRSEAARRAPDGPLAAEPIQWQQTLGNPATLADAEAAYSRLPGATPEQLMDGMLAIEAARLHFSKAAPTPSAPPVPPGAGAGAPPSSAAPSQAAPGAGAAAGMAPDAPPSGVSAAPRSPLQPTSAQPAQSVTTFAEPAPSAQGGAGGVRPPGTPALDASIAATEANPPAIPQPSPAGPPVVPPPPPMPPPPQSLAAIQTGMAVSSTEARRIRAEQEQAFIDWHLDNVPGQPITFEHEGEPLRDAAVKRGEIEAALSQPPAPDVTTPDATPQPTAVSGVPDVTTFPADVTSPPPSFPISGPASRPPVAPHPDWPHPETYAGRLMRMKVAEHDAEGRPDADYRQLMSAGARDLPPRGMTWRDKALYYADLADRDGQREGPTLADLADMPQPQSPLASPGEAHARWTAAEAARGTRRRTVRVQTPQDVPQAASQVAEPTEAQKAAGNYQHGHISIGGLPIAIETPAGATRSGTSPDGTRWTSTMAADYGRIKRTTGADGDQVDVFLGPQAHEATKHPVWIIDQVDTHAGRRFDEHKAMVGFPTQDAARHAYLASFSDDVGTDRIGAMTQMPWNQFKRWAKGGDTKKALAYKPPRLQTPKKPRQHKGLVSLLQFLAGKGGLKPHGDLKAMDANRFVFGFGQLVRKAGMDLDRAREAAEEAGYIRSRDGAGTTTRDLLDAIDREVRGQKVFSEHEAGDAVAAEDAKRADTDADRRDTALAEVDDWAEENGAKLTGDERNAIAQAVMGGMDLDEAAYETIMRRSVESDTDLADAAPDDTGWDIPFDFEGETNAATEQADGPGPAPEEQGGQAAGPVGRAEDGGEPGRGERDGSGQDAGQPAADDAGGGAPQPEGEAAGGVAPKRTFADLIAANRAREAQAAALAAESGPLVLQHKPRFDGDQWGVLISPDPDGGWRGSRFDRDGFSGHWNGKTKAEIVATAMQEGYADTDRNLLRTVMQDPRFQAGNEMTEQMQRERQAPATETVDTLDGKREQGLIDGIAPITDEDRKAAAKPTPAPAQQAPGGMFGPVGQTDLVAATAASYGNIAAPNQEALTEAFRKRIAEGHDFPSVRHAMTYAGQLLGAPVLPGSRASVTATMALAAARRDDGPRFSQTAWHGSPHDHERFDATKIGTGEGNQAFGFGHYFANRRAIAEHYRDKLTAKQRPGEKGRLYQVTIPDDHEFLSWDAPLADQSPQVKAGLAKLPDAFWEYAADELENRGMNPMERDDPDYTGRELYQVMKRYASEGGFDLGADQIIGGAAEDNNGAVASTVLLQNGVAGIRYFDNASRAAGEGSQNYVVFDDAKVAIAAKESRGNPRAEAPMPGAGRTLSPEAIAAVAQAVEAMTGGQASVRLVQEAAGVDGVAFGPLIVAALNPNTAWTLHHESIHVLRNLGVLRPAEWATLKAAAEKGGWAKEFDILRRYANLGAEAQMEEAVADKFGQWSTAGTPQPKGMVGRAWNRVKGFVARTGNALHGRGFQTADDVFQRIKSGEVGKRQPGSQGQRRGPQTVAEALHSLAMFSQMDAVKADRLDAMLSEMRFALPPRAQGTIPFAPASTFAAPAESRLDSFLYEIQDKHIDTKRVVEAVERAGRTIGVPSDPYLAEELYHGRTAKRTSDFISEELRPLLQDMVRRGVSKADLEKFLHARHAEERNDQIARINPALPDGGSGMLTADALAYLRGLTATQRRDFSAIAQQVDAIISRTQQTLVDYELESQDTIDTWNNAYAHYVPLYREDMEHAGGGMGTGAGFSVRGGASRRALGSDREVTNILGNLALQRERAIVRGEKNIVANALIELVRQAPNAYFWALNRPALKKVIDSRTGLVTLVVDPNYKGEPNVVVARSLGRGGNIIEQTVTFNPRNKRAMRMSRALKNLDMDDLGHVLGPVSQVTRFIAAMNTQYNPVFGITNLIRDVQEGMLNLTTTPIAGKQAQVAAYVPQALAGIYSDLRAIRRGGTASTSWGRLWEDFQHHGGQTGFRDLWATSEDRAKAIEAEIKRVTEGKAKQFGRAVFGWLSDYNEAIENSVRLSAYKVAIDSGMERERAASLAKNLTVNFNRKGAMTTQIAALYAFFNASVQGTTRALETLAGPKGKMIVAGGIVLGSLQAFTLDRAGFTDAEMPGFTREKNTVIPLGEKRYGMIPMPLGFSVIPSIGRLATEIAIEGGKDAGKKVAEMVGILLNSSNPLGGSGLSMQTLSPTVLDPLAAVAENKDWTGRSIARENQSSLDPRPGHERKKDTATWFSDKVSRALNALTGGTEFQPGGFSPSPDQLDYIVGQFTGGAAREVMKAEQTIRGAVTGDPVPPNKIPLLGRFYGNAAGPNAVRTAYYENIKRLNGHEAEIKGLAKAGQNVTSYIQKHPEATMFGAANREGSAIAKMQKVRRDMAKAGYSKERLQALDAQIVERMKRFNEAVQQAEKR